MMKTLKSHLGCSFRRHVENTGVHSLLAFLVIAIASHWGHAEVRGEANAAASSGTTVLWERVDVRSRNLFYGPGGEAHQPRGTMTFQEEDKDGSNPKYDVRDHSGTKWKVKLAAEARPETAASRLLWAIGYFTNEDYFLRDLKVEGVPKNLNRGREQIDDDGTMHEVRLKRYVSNEKKIADWQWKDNPFRDTREFNGLRVMMAVLNNWDLKDVNNAIYEKKPADSQARQIYMVSDLGATLGTTGRSWTQRKSKGNLLEYQKSKFITRVTSTQVDFSVPSRPSLIFVFGLPSYISRVKMRWIGKGIPREHAKWIGQELARLSPEQIRDAFRSAGYSPQEVEGFASVVESRIIELNKL